MIVAVDGEPTKGLAFTNVVSLLRGRAGSTVTVAIVRLGWAEPREVKVVRERIAGAVLLMPPQREVTREAAAVNG